MQNNRKGLALIMALIMALAAAGCGQKAATVEKAPLVKTQQAGSGTEADTGTYAGTVRGRYETNLAFQVGGGHFVGFSQREELQGVAPLYRLGEVNAGGHLIGAII